MVKTVYLELVRQHPGRRVGLEIVSVTVLLLYRKMGLTPCPWKVAKACERLVQRIEKSVIVEAFWVFLREIACLHEAFIG